MDNLQKIIEDKEQILSGIRSLTYTGYNTLQTQTMQQLRDHLPLLSISVTLSSSKDTKKSSYRQNAIEPLNQGNKSRRHGLRFTNAERKSTSVSLGSKCGKANTVNPYRTPLPSSNNAAHSGFETQRRRHQKSKTGVSMAPQKKIMSSKNVLIKKKMHNRSNIL